MKFRKRFLSLLMALSLALALLPTGFSAADSDDAPPLAVTVRDLNIPFGRVVTLDAGVETTDLQWQVQRNELSGWENLLGACSRLLSFPVDLSCDGYQYRCLLSGDGSVWSDTYRLSVFFPFSGGTGTPDDPYLISTPDDLLFLSQDVASGHSYTGEAFLQTENLNLADIDWAPIGQRDTGRGFTSHPFSGSYDGQNYEIQNLSIPGDGASASGQPVPDAALFGYIKGGFFDGNFPVLKNIRLVSPNIQGYSRAGALVGTGYRLDIINCSAVDVQISGGSGVGGLCGVLLPRFLRDSFASGEITAEGPGSMTGGLVGALTDCPELFSNQDSGHTEFTSVVERCGSDTDVTASGSAVGGFAGSIDFCRMSSAIEDCFAVGDVTGGSCTGGFAGIIGGAVDGLPSGAVLSRCYASGAVLGQDNVGGMVGLLHSAPDVQAFSHVFSLSPVLRAEFDQPGYATVGRVFGQWSASDASAPSLSSAFALSGAQTISGVLPSGPFEDIGSPNLSDGRDGIPVTASVLRQIEVWEDVGFDFSSVWRWDTSRSGPVLQSCPTPSSIWVEEETFRRSPGNQTIPLGAPAFFFALFANPEAVFQWQTRTAPGEWTDLSGENGPGLRLDEVSLEQNGLEFRCRASLPGDIWIASDPARLSVEPTALTRQPEDCAAFATGTAVFSVGAEGQELRYQWQQLMDYGWADISGATSADYTLKTNLYDSGMQFRCAVTLEDAVVYSRPARLTVWEWNPRIRTADDLLLFSSRVAKARDTSVVSALQTADIDLAGHDWVPIGSADRPFEGTYNGGGYRVSNLKASGDLPAAGLFGVVRNSRLSGIVLENPDVRSDSALPDAGAGALAGRAEGGTSIYQSCAFGGSVESAASAGGLVGLLQGDGNVLEQCWTRLSVSASGNGQAGGLVGGGAPDSTGSSVQNCYAAGTVTAGPGVSSAAGGLVGRLYGGTVELCFTAGTVSVLPSKEDGDSGSGLGGIGLVDGTVTSCAAVLSSMCLGTDTLYARISPDGVCSGNLAWSGTDLRRGSAMIYPIELDESHGQEETREALVRPETWTGLGYRFDSVWEWQPEGYPALKNTALLCQTNPFSFAPEITAHPEPLVVGTPGQPITFAISARGEAPLFQWQKSDSASGAWADISGAVEPGLTISKASVANSGYYRCVIVDWYGETLISQTARLMVKSNNMPAYITAQPTDVETVAGDMALFTIAAGPASASYQWQVSSDGGINWQNLSGATASILRTGPVTGESAAFHYRCLVSTKAGSDTSVPVRAVIVKAYEENPLLRLSLRRATPWLPTAGPGEDAANYSLRPGEGFADVRLRNMTTCVWSDNAVSLTASPIPGWRATLGSTDEPPAEPFTLSLTEGENWIPIKLTALDNPQKSIEYRLCIQYAPQLKLSSVSVLGGVVAGAVNNGSYVLNPVTDRSGGRQLTVISGSGAQPLALRLQIGAGAAASFGDDSVTAGDDGLVTLSLGVLPEGVSPFFPNNTSVNLGTLRMTHPLAGGFSNDYRVVLAARPSFVDASIVSYSPAPGPEVNGTGWGTDWDYLPLLTGAGRDLQSTRNGPGITLGCYGGSVIFGFDSPVRDDPAHPFGIDFKVYGNYFTGDKPESGVIEVAQDTNGNGQPDDDEWFTIAGSEYYNYGTILDYERTYFNPSPGQPVEVPWTDNLGNTGTVPPSGSRPVFPDTGVYGPAVWKGTDTFGGVTCPVFPVRGIAAGAESGQAEGPCVPALFGYCDVVPNPALPKFGGDPGGTPYRTQLSNPYTGPGEGCGIDIAWAVDRTGKPAALEQIDFVRVYSSSTEGGSTEVTGLSRMESGEANLSLTPAPGSLTLNGEPLSDDGWEVLGFGAYFRTVALQGGKNSIKIAVRAEESDTIVINNMCFPGSGTYTTSVYPDGSRTVRVIVQRANQLPRIYVLSCVDGGSPEGGTELAGVTLRPGDLTVTSNGDVWSCVVPHNAERVSLTASPLSPGATLLLGGEGQTVLPPGTPSVPFPVEVGENRIPLTVRSADGSRAKTYTILITRLREDPQPPDAIQVYFSLTGDTNHAPGAHLPESWISETGVILPPGATIRYLTDLMLHNSGRSFQLTSGRLEEVGGLAAMANGPLSRWVFRCNGKLVDQPPEGRVLQPGDKIEWLFSDDYTQEKDREDPWNKPTDPGGSDSDGSGNEPDQDKPTAVPDAPPLSAADLAARLQAAAGDKTLTLELSAPEMGAEVRFLFSPYLLVQLTSESGIRLTIKTPYADITLPPQALLALSAQATGSVTLSAGRHPGGEIWVSITDESSVDVPVPGGFTALFPASQASPALVAVSAGPDGTETVLAKSACIDGNMTARLTGSSLIRLVERPVAFSDVGTDRWSADSVTFAAARGLFQGDGDGGFLPESPMSRAMLTTVLWRLEDQPDVETAAFSDIVPGSWYAGAAAWAGLNGIVSGNGTGFAPDQPVTREQLAVMLYRYAGTPAFTPKTDIHPSLTADELPSSWAAEAVAWARAQGLMTGRETGFVPQGLVTREETATVLERLIRLLLSSDG